jgi:hypothetical protein
MITDKRKRQVSKPIRKIPCPDPCKISWHSGRIEHHGEDAAHILAIAESAAANQVRIPGYKPFHSLLKCNIFYLLLDPGIDLHGLFPGFGNPLYQGIHGMFQFGPQITVNISDKSIVQLVQIICAGKIGLLVSFPVKIMINIENYMGSIPGKIRGISVSGFFGAVLVKKSIDPASTFIFQLYIDPARIQAFQNIFY